MYNILANSADIKDSLSEISNSLSGDYQCYFQDVMNGKVPAEFPNIIEPEFHGDGYMESLEMIINFKNALSILGLFCCVDLRWTKNLADLLVGKNVLEIMSGSGHLANALSQHGVSIKATDINPSILTRAFDIEKKSALDAVKSSDADVLLVSWPPYGCDALIEACKSWGEGRPIVYIGEKNGCCAPAKFFEHFEVEGVYYWNPNFLMIQDNVYVGFWKN